MTKIKKIELEKEGKTVKATLEKNGVDYIFYAKTVDTLDEKKFKSLLKFWDEKAIPEKEAEEKLTEVGVKASLKKLEGKTIE